MFDFTTFDSSTFDASVAADVTITVVIHATENPDIALFMLSLGSTRQPTVRRKWDYGWSDVGKVRDISLIDG